MWNVLLLSLASAPHSLAQPAPTVEPREFQQQKDDAEFERRRKEAGNDVDKLWDVYKWCKEQKKDDKGRSVLRQLLKIDPNHEDANVALGNIKYDGKWFPSQKKVDEYKKEQIAKQEKADGLVEYKGQRVPPADVPFLEKGMVKDDDGNWVNAEELKKKKEGWLRQDLEWVAPTDKENIDKGLWKVGDKWLTLDEANKEHSDLGNWWRIPSEHYWLYTTCDRGVAIDKVKKNLDQAWDDIEHLTGLAPKHPPIVVVLRDTEQYNAYATGDPDIGIDTPDLTGMSSVRYAFFSETAGDPATNDLMQVGVGYWDASSADGNSWGPHSVRAALALSCIDALDPSKATLEKAKKAKRVEKSFVDNYYAEKKLPVWYRLALVGYVERYYIDRLVPADGNSRWAREWSVKNLVSKGGLRPLKQLFELKEEPEGTEEVPKLMNELGLVMSFIVDGKCDSVTEKFKVVQKAIQDGKDKAALAPLIDALAQEVVKQETALRKFANI